MLFNIASLVAVALAAATATSSVEAKPTLNGNCHFDNLLVFGDSYSDIGNVYKLSNKAWPLKTYDHGRFSNGPVWSEHVASHKHLKLKTYAFGGATTDSAFPIPKKDLASSLFVVDFQGNDYFFNPAASPTAVVANIEKGIEKLVQLGAQNILLVENFDYGTIPYFGGNATISGPFSQAAKAQLVAYKDLEKRLAKKYGRPSDAKHPFRGACHKDNKTKVTFGYYKLNEFFNHIREPKVLQRLGITDVAHGCVSNDYKTVCKDAGKHLFWDAFHPTAKIHKALGDAITELI
ncbi:hypothetical protein BGZ89_003152 [Linnemannia elongata]|nr:hypothetical protein BGZ89_003152 [Linnemannia elongata]